MNPPIKVQKLDICLGGGILNAAGDAVEAREIDTKDYPRFVIASLLNFFSLRP